MDKPQPWNTESNRHAYRVEFHFVSPAGNLLKSKTVELRKEDGENPKAMLLQTKAALPAAQSTIRELAPHYWTCTTCVMAVEGEPSTSVFSFIEAESLDQKLAAYSLTLGVVLTNEGLQFFRHTTTKKQE